MSEPLFSQSDLGLILENKVQKARAEVDGYEEDYLLNASEIDLTNYIFSRFAVAGPVLADPFMLEPVEVDVEIPNNPIYGRGMNQGRYMKGSRVEVHIPFTGESGLFHCRPSQFTFNMPHAEVRDKLLVLIYDRPGQVDSGEIKTEFANALSGIRANLDSIQHQCDAFNSGLEELIRRLIAERKGRILKNRQAVLSIGLPLKQRAGAPQTYTVPSIVRKPEIRRPVVKDKKFDPEPTLAEQEYEHMLGIIRSMVSVMERSPKAFVGMGEEDLRTQFLVQLNGQYQGRATGETFNYNGKTDILIREADRNVFIAECKIWKGEGELLKAIDQILGYLHWRDTKTALLVFNRNRSFSDVLSKIPAVVLSHACCKRLVKQTGETEWRFVFRNADDSNRELQMAVMVFDVPKETK